LRSSREPVVRFPRASTGLSCTETRTGDRVEVAAVGDLDLATKPTLVATVARLIREGLVHLELNLDGVPFSDSTGLTALIETRRMCDDAGCTLQLSGLQPFVASLLTRTGVGTYLNATTPA
jgi:anti-sigma B factor antagonist